MRERDLALIFWTPVNQCINPVNQLVTSDVESIKRVDCFSLVHSKENWFIQIFCILQCLHARTWHTPTRKQAERAQIVQGHIAQFPDKSESPQPASMYHINTHTYTPTHYMITKYIIKMFSHIRVHNESLAPQLRDNLYVYVFTKKMALFDRI